MAESKKEVYFCPKCGSTNTSPVAQSLIRGLPEIKGRSFSQAISSIRRECKDCGFVGIMVMSTPEDIVKYKKELKENP